MQNELFLVLRVLSALIFFVSLYAGYYMFRNFDRLFGPDPSVPSENGSARGYNRVQVFSVWAHVVIAAAAFALMLH